MTKSEAVRQSNLMAGLRPQIIVGPGRPKYDRFLVEYSEVTPVQGDEGRLVEVRRLFPAPAEMK